MDADQSRIRWLWHLGGILASLYVVDIWASLTIPQARWINSSTPYLAGGWLAVGFSIVAAKMASKAWYLATAVAGLTLLLIMYAASV